MPLSGQETLSASLQLLAEAPKNKYLFVTFIFFNVCGTIGEVLDMANAQPTEQQYSIVFSVTIYFSFSFCFFQVLHSCVHGSNTYTQQSHYLLSLADLSSDIYDPFLPLGNVRNSEPMQFQSSADLSNLLTVAEGNKYFEVN